MQLHEYFANSLGQPFVHREPITAPVDRCAQTSGLIRDFAAGFFFPRPDALNKLLASEVVFRLALSVEQPLDNHLCRNAGVIHAGLPQRAVTFHAMETRQRVHDRVLERVPHVQCARHVGWRNYDAIRSAITLRCEIALFFPALVDALFNVMWLVGLVHQILCVVSL